MSKSTEHHTLETEQTTNTQPLVTAEHTAAIRHLNDELRRFGRGGTMVMTVGVLALGRQFAILALEEVACFEDFTADNDPYGEHDCAVIDVQGQRLIWKIDYFDETSHYGSPDPADPSTTTRVLTIMLAEEY